MNLDQITATAQRLPNGKTRYTVTYRGEVVEQMDSKVADYAVIHIQRWLPVGATDPGTPNPVADWQKYAEESRFAVRFSRKPKAAGARIEYGYCAGNVAIAAA